MKIYIQDYGPIKDAEIHFAPLLLITGKSNLGKSYVNYLFYYLMRSITWDMFQEIVRKKLNKFKETDKICKFQITENELRKWLADNVQSFMQSFLGNDALHCSVSFDLEMAEKIENEAINVEYRRGGSETPEDMPMGMHTCTVIINNEETSNILYNNDRRNEIVQLAFRISTFFQVKIFGRSIGKSVILPPARGSYVGESFSAKEMIASQAAMYKYFLQDYDFALHPIGLNSSLSQDEQFFISRLKTLLKGDLTTKDNKQYLRMNNGTEIPLTAAASSIKELSPLLFYLKNWPKYNFSFCLEEPEAHIHPSMQKDVADLIAACVNKGMMFNITTRSDYFLQRINQLLLLGRLRTQASARYEKFRKEHALNKRFYLDEKNVACYYFHEDADGIVEIENLYFGEDGLPLKTFYDVVRDLSAFDDELAVALTPERYDDDN